MKSFSKIQIFLSIFMFITINILFYFKYLSKISITWGVAACLLYLIFLFFLFRYRPAFSKKVTDMGIIGFIITAGILLFLIPKEIFSADRWIIIDLFWDSVAQHLYPYAQSTDTGNLPGAMPFYFILSYPFYAIREIGFMTLIALALLSVFFQRHKSVQNYSLFFILLLSSPTTYWEIFSRSTILFNAVLFFLYLVYLKNFNTFTQKQYVWSAIVGGLLFSIRNVFVLLLVVWGIFELFRERCGFKKIALWGCMFIGTFLATFIPVFLMDPAKFMEVNPFITQSSLVPSEYILLFVLLAAAGAFFCKNRNDVIFYGNLLLFGIVTVHVINVVVYHGVCGALFDSMADISYYIFCIPFLLHILTENTDKTKG